MDYVSYYDSPLGRICLKSDGRFLTGLCFDEVDSLNESKLEIFFMTEKWLDIYFSGKKPDFIPEFKIEGTKFRKDVWQLLSEIDYGQTMSYKDIALIMAKKMGKDKMSAQAIGNAVSHNPIALIIPCHRVIGNDGSLVGYAYGLERKRWLLEKEKASS